MVLSASAALSPVQAQPADSEPSQLETQSGNEQDTESSATPASRDEPKASLDLFYLRTREGTLVPVPDMSFDDFARLNQLDQKLTSETRAPAFELMTCQLRGESGAKKVTLQANLKIKQLQSGTIRVPLKFPEAVILDSDGLRKQVELIQFDSGNERSTSDGYVVWLKGDRETVHDLKFELDAAIAIEGVRTSLNLTLPASSDSSCEILVPGSPVDASFADGLRPIDISAQGSRSLLKIRGWSGSAALSWTPLAKRTNRPRRTVLEARGQHRVTVRGPNYLETESLFQFSGRGGRLESVKLRLPAGARLAESPPSSEYTITAAAIDAADRQSVEVWFQEPDDQPRDVILRTETLASVESEEPDVSVPIDVAGFEVIDAVRHFGRIALAAESAWLLRWEERANIRRVAHSSNADGADTVAAFEYSRQTAKLPVTIRRKSTRMQARTSVDLTVLSSEAKLEAVIVLRASGAPSSMARLMLPGWQVTSIEAPAAINRDQIRIDESDPLILPFKQPFTGELTVKVTATRTVETPEDADSIQEYNWRLPSIADAVNSPVQVRLAAQPSFVVTPREGLAEEASEAVEAVVPGSDARPTYLFRGDPTKDDWICSVQSKPQEISGQITGTAFVDQANVSMKLTVAASVLYEPIESFQFEFRDTGPREVSVFLDGQQLDTQFQSWSTDDRDESATLAVQLPQPVLGACTLELNYQSRIKGGEVDELRTAELPLPTLSSGDFERSSITLSCDAGLSASIDDAVWEVLPARSSQIVATSSRWANTLPLTIKQLASHDATSGHIVERVFWQTWLTKQQRQDRVVFTIESEKKILEFVLPDRADLASVQALINGKKVTPLSLEGRKLRLDLAQRKGRKLVELFLPFVDRSRRSHASMPQLIDAKWTRKLFWQVVLPHDELLFAPPIGVEAEDDWSFADVLRGHASSVDQEWLEQWSGGSQQLKPAEGANHYVFSSFGRVPSIPLRTIGRSSLLLIAAAAVFLLGILPSFLPSLQQPRLLIVLAIVIAFIAILFPIHTLLIAPAAALGVVLLVVSRLIVWWKAQRGLRTYRGRADTKVGSDSSFTPRIQTAPTTITTLPPVHVSAPDN